MIIFGVPEREPANLAQRVEEVFNEMKVRPSVREISFVGKQSAGASSRPIKVKLSSPSIVKTILGFFLDFIFLYFVTNIVQYQCSDEAVVTEKLINQ